jgi:TolB-like protein/Flp pilus assembly protein TadD
MLLPRLARWSRKAFGTSSAPPIRSLAVLPMESFSANPSGQYLADGIMAVLTTELGEIHALRVIAPNSMVRYRSRPEPLAQIARELRVDALLDGAVEQSRGRVRLTYRLIRPANNRELWTRTYEFDLGELAGSAHRIAEALARAAHVPLTIEEQAHFKSRPMADRTAVDAFLHGESLLAAGTEESLASARAAFERAIVSSPDYAPAYAGLAEAYLSCACKGLTRADVLARVRTEAIHALELDESLAVAHSALGFANMTYDYDWLSARRELKRAIDLNPSLADAHRRYAEYLVRSGRFAEGIDHAGLAADLDPLSAQMSASVGMALFFARHTDAAIEQFEKSLRMDPAETVARAGLGMAYLQTGRFPEAALQFQQAISLGVRVPELTARLAEVYARMGQIAAARKTALDLSRPGGNHPPPAYAIALVYAALGDHSSAMDWLEKAFVARDPEISLLKVDPALDALRDEPRFQALVHRAGIP